MSIGDTTTLSPERAVQLKNPQARQGLSNFGPFGPVNPHAHQGVSKGDTTILGPKGRRPLSAANTTLCPKGKAPSPAERASTFPL